MFSNGLPMVKNCIQKDCTQVYGPFLVLFSLSLRIMAALECLYVISHS